MAVLQHSCRLRWIPLLGAACLFAIVSRAQVAPASNGGDQSYWIGAEYSNIHAGFPYQSSHRLAGIGVFADLNWDRHFGVEADARFLHFNSYHGESEDSYLAGPRYTFRSFGKFQPYAKGLVGVGRIHYPFKIGTGTYLAIAPGAGVRYRISHRWSLRGEYEYQWWPNSPGFANEPSHRLTPNGFHVGIAWRPFR